ncbi:MAG TPA: aminopeptidase [Candidatus Binataceae bacterium]|nr:aminopeptidase [Candidatus Binataceae bacterium]
MLPGAPLRTLSAAEWFARLRAVRVAIAMLAVAALAIGVSGCELGYITRGAYEEMRLLWNRKPIDEVLARSDLPADTRAKLKTVLEVRDFARDRLGLKVGGAYRTVSEVDRGAVVWVVMAAPRDALEPVTWWFPIVGRVPYRGYFDHQAALAEAKRLKAAGYDTFVRPAVAFSTLGFFNDPLLSNLLNLSRVELAGVIIHELFHRTYFLASDAMFDESAATWVGSRGAVDFFTTTEGANSADAHAARGVLESDLEFASFLLQAQAQLLRLYQSGLSYQEIVKRRAPLFVKIRADYAALKPRLSGLERFDLDREPLNNAVLINYLIYFHQFWNFAALEQMHHQDTRATIAAIIELASANPGDPFYAIWEATRTAAPR